MKIEIKNFGPIGKLEFDLDKDLHLIYGENAIGKSYATYCIYCVLKNIKVGFVINQFTAAWEGEENPYAKFIENQLIVLRDKNVIDCTLAFNAIVQEAIRTVFIEPLKNSLLNSFASLKNLNNRYSKSDFEIIIHISNTEVLSFFPSGNGEIDLSYKGNLKKLEFVSEDGNLHKFALLANGEKVFVAQTENEFIREFIGFANAIVNDILRNFQLKYELHYLPASRSGLYQALNAFAPLVAELTQSRAFLHNKTIEIPSLPEPVSDYFLDLSTVNKNNINEEYTNIVELLQNEILRGNVDFNDQTKRIMYRPKGTDLELNLSESSSMVSELSPLVLYFKHILNNKYKSSASHANSRHKEGYDILFIEEPEAHLHPSVQVKLMEIFAMLTNYKLKIFITSHSNYMFNKVNNLLIQKAISPENVAVYHLVRSKEDNSTVMGNMEVTEEGINDENFSDVSEALYMERMNFLEKNEEN